MVMLVICVFLGVLCAFLFVRLLPVLCAIIAAVWLWNWLFHDPTWFVASIVTLGLLWSMGLFRRL